MEKKKENIKYNPFIMVTVKETMHALREIDIRRSKAFPALCVARIA
jgi:hypothetical protein